jgi:threonine/homoserine/homoserine lactone efflux protein
MLASVMVGLFVGLLYVIVPAPIDLVAAHRALRFGPGAGIAAQFGSMAADGLCAALALGVLLPLASDPRLQTPISIAGMAALVVVSAAAMRAMLRAPRHSLLEPAVVSPSYLVHACWGALATIASPFPLAYWASLGRTLARSSAPERWMIGAGFLIVDVAWAIGFPFAAMRAPRFLPAAVRQCARIRAALIAGGLAVYFGAQLASTVI